ncbi:MAG TPA: hypothetical protein VGR47_13775 [Terracidiphilus sp.]|nr:hypothetical protein [Terracidiphilus sp.]
MLVTRLLILLLLVPLSMVSAQTVLGIRGSEFTINGEPTYTAAQGFPSADPDLKGTLLNVRAVQAIFDDANYPRGGSKAHPYHSLTMGTIAFDYPDGPYRPERNMDEFIAALPSWRRAGVMAFTVNLQGGGPVDGNFSTHDQCQPQANSGFDRRGNLKPAYASRLRRVIAAADRLHMVVIVGFFYFGSECRIDASPNDEFTRDAIRQAGTFLRNLPDRNVLIEIANEVSLTGYRHPMLRADGMAGAVRLAQESVAKQIPVSFSWTGPLPPAGSAADAAFAAADFILFHTNGKTPEGVAETIDLFRARYGSTRPVLINEDGVSTFDLWAAVQKHVGWGYYDQGLNNYHDGFQSPPVNWQIDTLDKWMFFDQVARLTGSPQPAMPDWSKNSPAATRLSGVAPEQQVEKLAGIEAEVTSADPAWRVNRVEFFLDGKPYSYTTSPPYRMGKPMPWWNSVAAGRHLLEVVSYIRRGPAFSETSARNEIPFVLDR